MNTASAMILLAIAGICSAHAGEAKRPCEVNYVQTGKYMSGRHFSTWDVVIDVPPQVAFKRIYTEGIKSGFKVSSSDKEMGIISLEQGNAGSTLLNDGQLVSLPWNVVIEKSGHGSKINVAKTVPPTYATSKNYQIQSMCSVIDAARNPG